MTLVIPIGDRRFYYNRKINCMPAEGHLRYGEVQEQLEADLIHRLSGLGAWRLGVSQFLELGQRLRLST